MAKKYHAIDLLLAEAKIDHQQALTLNQDAAAFSQRAEDSNKQLTHTMHTIAIEKAEKAA
jgi:hypothetical protein